MRHSGKCLTRKLYGYDLLVGLIFLYLFVVVASLLPRFLSFSLSLSSRIEKYIELLLVAFVIVACVAVAYCVAVGSIGAHHDSHLSTLLYIALLSTLCRFYRYGLYSLRD